MKRLFKNKKHVVAYRNVLPTSTDNKEPHCTVASTCSTQWTQSDLLTPAGCLSLIAVQSSPVASTCSTQWTQCDLLTPAGCLSLIAVQFSPVASTCRTQWTQSDLLTPAGCLSLIAVQVRPTLRVLQNTTEVVLNGVVSKGNSLHLAEQKANYNPPARRILGMYSSNCVLQLESHSSDLSADVLIISKCAANRQTDG